MQEIKLRVWNTVSKEMTFFDTPYFTCLKEPVIGFANCVWSRIMIGGYTEAMQYIGRKDKNGKEIYEGDAFRSEDGILVVFYEKERCRFALQLWAYEIFTGENSQEVESDTLSIVDVYEIEDWVDEEVIGNIYENQELLGGRHG